MQRAVGLLHLDGEVHAGAPVQLRDDDAFSPVDDELSAADHDREFAHVNAFFHHILVVLTGQSAADTERPAVRQTQVAAFLRLVSRFAEFVIQVLQLHLSVVADDRKYLPEQAFQTLFFPSGGIGIDLQEPLITGEL